MVCINPNREYNPMIDRSRGKLTKAKIRSLRSNPDEASYTKGSPEEAFMVVHRCWRTWEETEDAWSVLDAETSKLVSAFEVPDALSRDPVLREVVLDEQKEHRKYLPRDLCTVHFHGELDFLFR